MESSPPRAPLVSIVVPVFNGAQFLRASLDSILAQTFSNVEVITIDDASTDGTPQVLAEYGPPVQVYRQARNRGIYGSANEGIARARGEFIAVYHADDIYEPQTVERQVDFLVHYPEAGAVFCLIRLIDAGGREMGRIGLPSGVASDRPLEYSVILNGLLRHKNHFLMCPTSMVRASVYRNVGPYRDEQFRNTSDLDMWLRVGRAYSIGILSEYLVGYRRGHGSSSERYHHLRTDEERYFTIMDLGLRAGDRALAAPDALAAYEAHRAEDQIMRVVSFYILNQRKAAHGLLGHVSLKRLLASQSVRRGRLSILWMLLQLLVRLPRIPALANLFYARWHPGRAVPMPLPS